MINAGCSDTPAEYYGVSGTMHGLWHDAGQVEMRIEIDLGEDYELSILQNAVD